jgi:acetylornithine/N-succinyldiaminopimelate aminotransferase
MRMVPVTTGTSTVEKQNGLQSQAVFKGAAVPLFFGDIQIRNTPQAHLCRKHWRLGQGRVRMHGILLIVDEVQAGMGRTGKLFAYQLSDIEPDIMTLGQGSGGGVPLAALLCTEACAVFEPCDQGGTYNGNPLMTAVGMAVLEELLKPGFLHSVLDKGAYLREGLLKLSDKHGLEGERGEGLLRALKLGAPIGGKIVEIARDLEPQGLLLNSPRPELLRFMPALNVTTDEIDQTLELRSKALLCAS